MLPLHKDAQGAKKGADFHAGLWYDRFFNKYDNEYKVADEGKLQWIQTVTASPVGDQGALARAANRQHAVAEACGGKTLVMTTDWHFVTGMGNNHPVENGFAWHHTLGVPYLTGAAVKGMVRAWCEIWQAFDDDKIKHWFGGDEQAGELIFFDALPTESVKLKADIMTPHYDDWYAKGGEIKDVVREPEKVPADWHDPVPVPFLVVDKGASFQFSVAKRAHSSIELPVVIKALSEALQWLGSGAKTAAGYGRFSESTQAKQNREKTEKKTQAKFEEEQKKSQLEEQVKASGLLGLALDIAMLISEKGLEDDKTVWIQEANALIEQIQNHDNEQEKQTAVQLLMDICEKHDAGILKNPNKTQGKRNKPVYKPNPIAIAKALTDLNQCN